MAKVDNDTYKWMTGVIQDKWLTDEIQEKLRAIKNPHAAKKRTTIIRLAFAQAMQVPIREIFAQKDVCNEATWYTKWQYEPEIRAAYDACCRRALDWVDEELAGQEECYRRQRRLGIAKWSAVAPDALGAVMLGHEQKGADRISAANSLITWADPEAAGKAQPPPPPDGGVDIQNVGLLTSVDNNELDKLIANIDAAIRSLEAGAAQSAASQAKPPPQTNDQPADLDDAQAADDRPED